MMGNCLQPSSVAADRQQAVQRLCKQCCKITDCQHNMVKAVEGFGHMLYSIQQ